jgi:hypothetical protein
MHRIPTLLYGISLCGLLPMAGAVEAADAPDLGKIDRRILKEPDYVSGQPLYGLYVFGPEARTRVWAVLDKSGPNAGQYDVLYFDRNADGDLTGPDKRIEGEVGRDSVTFSLGSFTDPVTGHEHTELSITRHEGRSARVMLRMKWRDQVVIRGGYAPEAGPYTQFAATPAEAPVLWPGADGPFSFQFWLPKPLTIGRASDVRVFLGHQGHGPNTFCAVPDTFLPREVPVLATLIYTDQDGKEKRAQSELRERC